MPDIKEIITIVKPFVIAILIILTGHFITRWLVRMLRKGFKKSSIDISLASFFEKALNIICHILIILSALSYLKIPTGGFIAALSACAVGIAIALKDSLNNIAGGILLLISPRFSSGDYIKSGDKEGKVLFIDLLHTTIITPDNRRISIPNGVLINSDITNYSKEEKRRVDITFSVNYECDIEKAKEIALNVIKNHPLVVNEPDIPFARVFSYGESAVNIITRSWCKTDDYWKVYFDLTENIRKEFDKENISIPYNQLDVHIINK